MEITKVIKIICDNCDKELDMETKNYISFDCNDTGYSESDYTCHYCDLKCVEEEKKKLLQTYEVEELEEMSIFYNITKYLDKNGKN
jgi:hypothetical protein